MNKFGMVREDVPKTIRQEFGGMFALWLGDPVGRSAVAISTSSLGLDSALGIGGLSRGRIVECYGYKSSWKTTLALHIVANAQKAGALRRSLTQHL